MGKRKGSGVMVPEAPDISQITRDLGRGRFAIKQGSPFGPLARNAFVADGNAHTELTHRNWDAVSMVGEMASVRISSPEDLRRERVAEYMKTAKEIQLLQSVHEMITTSQGAMDLLEKVRLDVDYGLAETPLLYGPLYERVNGPFPGGAVQIGADMVLDANVIFMEKLEAEEVVFGTIAKSGAPTFVPITTYAAGFEWTEDMLEFDRTWEIGMNARAFGRSYNHLLNHLHISPILSYSYTAPNQTPADATAGATQTEKALRTFQSAYRTAAMAVPQRIPTVILANEADRFLIEDALLTPVLDAAGNPLRRVPVDTIIYYNGATVTNGVEQAVYPGVTAGKCYFIMPRFRMKELVHHDLRIDIGAPDISRLVEGQQVARTRRGLYLDIPNSVEEVTLP